MEVVSNSDIDDPVKLLLWLDPEHASALFEAGFKPRQLEKSIACSLSHRDTQFVCERNTVPPFVE